MEGLTNEQRGMFEVFGLDLPALPSVISADPSDLPMATSRDLESRAGIDDVVDALVAEVAVAAVAADDDDEDVPTETERNPGRGRAAQSGKMPAMPNLVPA
jgi:hypothetical protein